MNSNRPRSVPPTRISDLEDARVFTRLLSRLRESYPPKNVQHESDLSCLARLNWQTDRIANLIETDLNHRLKSELLRRVADPSLRLLKATMPGISRMPIKATRALLNAALDGSLNDAEFRKDPNFGFDVPVAVAGVDAALLDPRGAWADADDYDRTAQTLVRQFIDNFAQFADHVDEGVRKAAPTAA